MAAVQSPYGSATATADASGAWRIQVKFDKSPPIGKAFTVYAGCLANQQKFPFAFTVTG
jgi:hypothetical protein